MKRSENLPVSWSHSAGEMISESVVDTPNDKCEKTGVDDEAAEKRDVQGAHNGVQAKTTFLLILKHQMCQPHCYTEANIWVQRVNGLGRMTTQLLC